MKIEEKVGEWLRNSQMTLATAESCTGGGVAALVTSVPGSSEYFKGGIVAYSNEVKMRLLGVSAETLEKHGAVSRETVIEMAHGAMKTLKTDCRWRNSGQTGGYHLDGSGMPGEGGRTEGGRRLGESRQCPKNHSGCVGLVV